MTQYAYPDADTSDGSWQTQNNNQTDLYAQVNDEEDQDDSDDGTTHIKSVDNGSNDVCILRLSDVDEPDSTPTYIRYRAVTTDESWMGSGPGLKLELLESSDEESYTLRGAATSNFGIETDGSTYTSYSTAALDVSGVSDWGNLYIRLTMLSQVGMGDTMYITQLYLETQDAAAASGATATPAAFLLFVD